MMEQLFLPASRLVLTTVLIHTVLSLGFSSELEYLYKFQNFCFCWPLAWPLLNSKIWNPNGNLTQENIFLLPQNMHASYTALNNISSLFGQPPFAYKVIICIWGCWLPLLNDLSWWSRFSRPRHWILWRSHIQEWDKGGLVYAPKFTVADPLVLMVFIKSLNDVY